MSAKRESWVLGQLGQTFYIDVEDRRAKLMVAAPKMQEAMGGVKSRLEAWIEHHRIRYNNLDQEEDYNAIQNYQSLIDTINKALPDGL